MIAEQERNTWDPLDQKVLDTIREIEAAEEDMADMAAQIAVLEIQVSELSTRLFRELAEAKGAYDAWIAAVKQEKPPVESEAKADLGSAIAGRRPRPPATVREDQGG